MQEHAGYSGPNRLLLSLTPDDFKLLRPSLAFVHLQGREMLETADEVPKDIYFPEGSVASVVASFRNHKSFEVGLIGWEGMTGTSVLTGTPSPFDCYVQFIGSARRLSTDKLMIALDASHSMRMALSLYAHNLSIQTAYTALASAHAPITERLARWLMMINDRVAGESFDVTHDLLAIMLGVRRSGVTSALHELEGEGLIRSTRGKVEIRNRAALIIRAGNAYGKTEKSYDEMLEAVGPDLVKPQPRPSRPSEKGADTSH